MIYPPVIQHGHPQQLGIKNAFSIPSTNGELSIAMLSSFRGQVDIIDICFRWSPENGCPSQSWKKSDCVVFGGLSFGSCMNKEQLFWPAKQIKQQEKDCQWFMTHYSALVSPIFQALWLASIHFIIIYSSLFNIIHIYIYIYLYDMCI